MTAEVPGPGPMTMVGTASATAIRVGGRAHRIVRIGVVIGFSMALFVLQMAMVQAIQGQVVRGRLVEAADAAGIPGAMISLIDRSGRIAEQILTRGDNGFFELRASELGEYRLRAERIGYRTTFSAFFTISAGDTLTVEMSAPIEALSLKGISATVAPRCHVRPDEGLAVAKVWDEARKALAAATWTQERGLYRYEMLGIKRFFDERGRRVELEDRVYAQSLVPVPYVARAADSLVNDGFARMSVEASEFWAPDAGVLLSDLFLDTHCLRIRSGGSDLVGLDFEPVPNRVVPDIAGTLWLDRSTAELQRVDFRYVNLPVPQWLMDASPGGAVLFRALPNGTWIVSSWHIRMFSAGAAENPLTGRLVPTLEGVTTTHGEVLRVLSPEGVVFEGSRGRRVVGTVVDSLGVGLPGALVYVEGTGTGTETDVDGRFELDQLGVGTYELQFTHPYLDQLWHEPNSIEVEVGPDMTSLAEVRFEAPSKSDVLEAVCGRDRPPGIPVITADRRTVWRTGILTGRVTDKDGTPVNDATLHLLAKAHETRLLAEVRDPNTFNFEDQRLRWSGIDSDAGICRYHLTLRDFAVEFPPFDSRQMRFQSLAPRRASRAVRSCPSSGL